MVSVDGLPFILSEETPFTAAVPLRDLTEEARAELERAKEALQHERRMLEDCRAEALELNSRSNAHPSNLTLIRQLLAADARVAAAASWAVPDFPGSVAVAGAMFVVDVETGLGRYAHIEDDRPGALRHFEAALEVVAQTRAYLRIRSVDGPVYGIAARAVTAAAELAADRKQGVEAFLSKVDSNIVRPYASLMADRDLADTSRVLKNR